jgi:hypothetical protein
VKSSKNIFNSVATIVVMLSLLMVHQRSSGANANVVAAPDTNKIKIGEQFHINFSAVAPKGTTIDFPQLTDTFNHFEIVSRGRIDTVREKDKTDLTLKQQLTVTSFDSGFYVIPPFQFISHHAGTSDTILTEASLMTVVTVAVDTTKEIRPLKGIMDVPFPWLDYLLYVLIAIVVFIIAYYVYLRYQKKPAVVIKKPVNKRPAHEIALERLHQIQQEKIWAQGNIKKYYSDVTDTLRQYIEERFSVFAMEQTTDEILHHFENKLVKAEEKEKLSYILRLADMVKFAKAVTVPSENETSLQYAFDFVNLTRPVMKEDIKQEVNP